ncbi:MAG: FAD-dependent oxidoreductase [Acidimicrobiia bacterium]
MTVPTLVIIGAGLAGANAAEAARETDADARIVLIGDEPDAPYERPPLSKASFVATRRPTPPVSTPTASTRTTRSNWCTTR